MASALALGYLPLWVESCGAESPRR